MRTILRRINSNVCIIIIEVETCFSFFFSLEKIWRLVRLESNFMTCDSKQLASMLILVPRYVKIAAAIRFWQFFFLYMNKTKLNAKAKVVVIWIWPGHEILLDNVCILNTYVVTVRQFKYGKKKDEKYMERRNFLIKCEKLFNFQFLIKQAINGDQKLLCLSQKRAKN